ncbi:MAG: P1 family peptidase [Clostridiales bacterium]|nr:P1 family peptidase [Clostridiales bacterium]
MKSDFLQSFKIGHYTDEIKKTGVTVILSEKGATGGVSIRGAAPATRETDLLDPQKTVDKVNAVVLSGGSAFGLEASSGVMEYLFEKGFGFNAGKYNVPIVCGASIYDLEFGSFGYPDKTAGYKAASSAEVGNFVTGQVGAGIGATCGKILGMSHASRGGIGVKTAKMRGVEIAVIVVVNPLGDVVRGEEILAGTKLMGKFIGSAKAISKVSGFKMQNTTIGCILTNAKLSKAQACQLADVAHDGFARAIDPSHTIYDGDAMFTLASGEKSVDFIKLCAVIPRLTAEAIYSIYEGMKSPEELFPEEEE